MTSEGFLFTAVFDTIAAERLRAVFANLLQIRRVIVVGYATDTLREFGTSSSLVAPQFVGVNAEGKIDLQSIKCPESARDQIALQTLKGDGSGKKMYLWKRLRIDGAFKFGWVDNDDVSKFAEGVSFEPGDGFWVQNDGEEGVNTFQTSGQVMENDLAILLETDTNSKICANCTPVALDLQDIICPESARDQIALQTLKGDGSGKKMYLWKRLRIDGAFRFGWVDNDDVSVFVEGVTFQPGEAFWVQNDGDEAAANTLTIPGVELK